MEFINLTGHTVTEVTSGLEIPRSGRVARVETTRERVATHGDVPIFETKCGALSGLPAPKKGVIYIVSALALKAVSNDRTDVVAPGNVVRDTITKQPIGCTGFRMKDTNG